MHYIKHTPSDIRKWQTVLTCFSAEALRKYTNHVMRHAYRRATFTATAYALHRAVSAAEDPLTFREEYLSDHVTGDRIIGERTADLDIWCGFQPEPRQQDITALPAEFDIRKCIQQTNKMNRRQRIISPASIHQLPNLDVSFVAIRRKT